eukprot:TRINITY_DN74790_c0_g1_i1.p1 TRINITY_DN74790_c0_g1~~TRINITY_DN74790_c0_g1_i1.p1  ORF type:complete len:421 (+),score=228.41 TRINITY_DN74790_c0_g1_i1:64-1326(+)
MSEEHKSNSTAIAPSAMAIRTVNPIRAVVDNIRIPKDASAEKPLIPLSIGDPTKFGNLLPPSSVDAELAAIVASHNNNGYLPSSGSVAARKAIAKRANTLESMKHREHSIDESDVIVTSGCSGAINVVFPTLADAGDNVLLPKPGFALYATVCQHYGIECRYYDCLPEKQWEVDLAGAAKLVDSRTKAILINNPSNPCGSVFSKQHIVDIVAFAEKHGLPIIADEIYADMVFSGNTFHSINSLSDRVPVLTLGGLAKQFLVPGWRVGWVEIHDRQEQFKRIKPALMSMSQLILGANSLVQAAVPHLLEKTPASYFTDLNATLEKHAMFCADALSKVDGLRVVVPQGAMYVMVGVDTDKFGDIADDVEFSQKLLDEEYVFVLPGSCFQAPNFFRIVFCAPLDVLEDAVKRMTAFAARHRKQ